MAKLISADIDLSKIDKTRIREGKSGQKYYDITISINDKKNDHGQDVSIMEAQTKAEREAGEKKKYLGNGKTFWTNEQAAVNAEPVATPYTDEMNAEDGRLPF